MTVNESVCNVVALYLHWLDPQLLVGKTGVCPPRQNGEGMWDYLANHPLGVGPDEPSSCDVVVCLTMRISFHACPICVGRGK